MNSYTYPCFPESPKVNVIDNSKEKSLSLNILKTNADLITSDSEKENNNSLNNTSCQLVLELKNKKKLSRIFFPQKNTKNNTKNHNKNRDGNSFFDRKFEKKSIKSPTQSENPDSIRSFIFLKYIKVKTNNKFRNGSDKIFLAQELYRSPLFKNSNQKKSFYFSESKSSGISMGIPFHKSGAIWAMKFSRDGKYLAAGGQDTILRVWMVIGAKDDYDNNTYSKSKKINNVDENSSTYDKFTAPVFFPDPIHEYLGHKSDVLDLSWSKNNFLLSSSMDKTVRLWHISRKECLCCFEHNDFVTSIAFHPLDDRYFLSGSLDCKLRFWNIKDKTVLFWNELPELITAVAFSPDGRMAIAGSFNGLCIFYETKGLRYHTQIHVKSSRGKNSKGSKITGIETICTMPDNNGDVKLLITSNDSRIRIYNMRDKSLETKLKGNQNTCSQIHATFSDDAKYVISGSEDGQVYIWKIDNESAIKKNELSLKHFEVDSNIVTVAIFAPVKSKDLLAASGDSIYNSCLDFRQAFSSHNNCISPILSNVQLKKFFLETPVSENFQENVNENPKHNHGDIIICADYNGKIKVFRYDCSSLYREVDTISEESSIKKYKLHSLRGNEVTKLYI